MFDHPHKSQDPLFKQLISLFHSTSESNVLLLGQLELLHSLQNPHGVAPLRRTPPLVPSLPPGLDAMKMQFHVKPGSTLFPRRRRRRLFAAISRLHTAGDPFTIWGPRARLVRQLRVVEQPKTRHIIACQLSRRDAGFVASSLASKRR